VDGGGGDAAAGGGFGLPGKLLIRLEAFSGRASTDSISIAMAFGLLTKKSSSHSARGMTASWKRV